MWPVVKELAEIAHAVGTVVLCGVCASLWRRVLTVEDHAVRLAKRLRRLETVTYSGPSGWTKTALSLDCDEDGSGKVVKFVAARPRRGGA